MMLKNVIIRANGEVEERLPITGEHYTLEEMRDAIGGGWIEIVQTTDGRLMVLDEEGKLKGLPINLEATGRYLHGDTDFICGDVLVCESWRVE